MNLFYQPRIPEGVHFLDEEESKHCVKVLRRKEGDAIRITDGQGFFYDAKIAEANPHKCDFDVVDKIAEKPKAFSIHLAIAPTKNQDRIEWFVEKTVEIGVDRISLIDCKNSERSFVKTDRLKKVAISAMKQSLKATLPLITAAVPFDSFVKNANATEKFIAYVHRENPVHLMQAASKGSSYLVLIGPEGDFAPDEIESALRNNFRNVSLGDSRLRTETAGIAACHILNLINT